MNIGFDAKRAYHNTRGLGNYSRDTVRILSKYYPDNRYVLFNPKRVNNPFFLLQENMKEIRPERWFWKTFPSLWRSKGICSEIKKEKIDVYHGLSQELPIGIKKTNVKSVVTVHDTIFLRYPEFYSASYRYIFTKKNQYACKTADKIIAISNQTKHDFIEFFGIDEKKITVVYQGCNSIFRQPVSEAEKAKVRQKYNLPSHFLLNVGAIEKRKNAALIVKAMHYSHLSIPLVIIGNPTDYKQEIMETAHRYHLSSQVFFLHNVPTNDLPAIYSQAEIFIYPSLFEGFGIPVLEALCCKVPVITSRGRCLEEAVGPSSLYIDPHNAEELGAAIEKVLSDADFRNQMISAGINHAENFTDDKIAHQLMSVYQSLF